MKVLGLETSCDETGLAIFDSETVTSENNGLLGQVLYSQIELHATYGGVVPELASRDHIRKLVPLLNELLEQCHLDKSQIDAIAYTKGPGLVGALMTGALFGRSLAYALDVPAIGIHHMEGHLLAPLLGSSDQDALTFPFVCLLVSGGHTQLVATRNIGDYEILGESIDDAAGECFDKAAKMLNLPYPGGPNIAKLAENGNPNAYELPRPMLHKGLDFSFSGMKTAVHNLIKDTDGSEDNPQVRADIAASFQHAVVDTLVKKCIKALKQTGMKRLIIAGGVSANLHLRAELERALNHLNTAGNSKQHKQFAKQKSQSAKQKRNSQSNQKQTMSSSSNKPNTDSQMDADAYEAYSVHYAPPSLCTDNGAMIAYAGYQRLQAGQTDDLAVSCVPRWNMTQLPSITISDEG